MANRIYGKARQAFAAAGINWTADTIKAVLIDTADYAVSIDVDEFLADIPAAAREEISPAFTGKTNVLGVLDADDAVFSGTAGDGCEAIAIFKDTGDPATSRLIFYIDTAPGLPVNLGAIVTIIWDNGANKIGKI